MKVIFFFTSSVIFSLGVITNDVTERHLGAWIDNDGDGNNNEEGLFVKDSGEEDELLEGVDGGSVVSDSSDDEGEELAAVVTSVLVDEILV